MLPAAATGAVGTAGGARGSTQRAGSGSGGAQVDPSAVTGSTDAAGGCCAAGTSAESLCSDWGGASSSGDSPKGAIDDSPPLAGGLRRSGDSVVAGGGMRPRYRPKEGPDSRADVSRPSIIYREGFKA